MRKIRMTSMPKTIRWVSLKVILWWMKRTSAQCCWVRVPRHIPIRWQQQPVRSCIMVTNFTLYLSTHPHSTLEQFAHSRISVFLFSSLICVRHIHILCVDVSVLCFTYFMASEYVLVSVGFGLSKIRTFLRKRYKLQRNGLTTFVCSCIPLSTTILSRILRFLFRVLNSYQNARGTGTDPRN